MEIIKNNQENIEEYGDQYLSFFKIRAFRMSFFLAGFFFFFLINQLVNINFEIKVILMLIIFSPYILTYKIGSKYETSRFFYTTLSKRIKDFPEEDQTKLRKLKLKIVMISFGWKTTNYAISNF